MKAVSLESVDSIYRCGKGFSLRWQSVRFPELQKFYLAIDRLCNALGEDAKNDFWVSIIRKLKKFRFDTCAAPMDEAYIKKIIQELDTFLREKEHQISLMYPNQSRFYTFIIKQLKELSKCYTAQLLTTLKEIAKGKYKESALLIKEPRLVSIVEESLVASGLGGKFTVINPALLREESCYKQIVIIGPSRWYPDYIFSAPRANNILVIKYSWIRDLWKPEPIFIEPLKQRASRKVEIVLDTLDQDGVLVEAEDLLLPSLDFKRIADKVSSEGHPDDNLDDVDARIFILEEGWAVFLEADDKSTALVIDLDRHSDHPLKRMKVNEIQPGMFVLLRTGGGGDYIIPVADQIMDDFAVIAREFQKEWKTHLRAKVKSQGYENVINNLEKLGSRRANNTNLHNWMSERNIRTEDFEDFHAIMKLIELEKQTDYYWDMMKRIDNAHIRAGQMIRRMLLEQVNRCDLGILKRTGKMDFTITGKQSVSITAFQVRDISPNTIPVDHWRIGDLFEADE